MKYQRGLQVKLQERYRRLFKSDSNAYHTEIKFLHQFFLESPVLKALLATLSASYKKFDTDEWIEANFTYQYYSWPPIEGQKLKMIWELIERWAEEDTNSINSAAVSFSMQYFHTGSTKINDGLRSMTEDMIEPLVEYLQRGLIDDNDLLYLLERHKRQVEWFDADRLFREYEQDTAHGEAVYDSNLRRFLFSEGVDYPFSQPASPSGRADVLADVDKDEALVCEVKMFNSASYGVPYVAKGLGQAVRYAHDWGKTVGYLAIFNVSDQALELPTDGERGDWPPRLHLEGLTIYLVLIQAKPLASASTSGKPAPRIVKREELVSGHGD